MNALAKYLTGFNAVLLGLLLFVGYRFLEVQALFYRFLPLSEKIRGVASVLIALVVVFSLLIFSSHIDQFRLHKNDNGGWIKLTMLSFTLYINLYFWKVWEPEVSWSESIKYPALVYTFKIVISLFFGAFDYAYNHLFIMKWYENQKEAGLTNSLAKLEQDLNNLEQQSSALELIISENQAKLSQVIARQDPKVCPRCGQEFDNSNQRNGHLRSCKEVTTINEMNHEEIR